MTVAAVSRAGWLNSRRWMNTVSGDRTFLVGLVLVGVMAVLAAGAQWIAPYSQTRIDITRILAAPSAAHLLGTDELGRDLLSRLMFGARVSLGVAAVSVALAAVAGTAAGGIAGLRGGWTEVAVLRATDVLLGFPEILVAIVLMAILGVSLVNVVIAIAVAYTPQFLRISWGSVLVLREQSFVQSAHLAGKSEAFIVLRHLVPNMAPELLVQATLSLGGAILAESSLSYLGLGVQPPLADWGSMISSGQEYISASMYYMLFPGLAIALTVLGFNLVGDGLTRLLDPRRGRLQR